MFLCIENIMSRNHRMWVLSCLSIITIEIGHPLAILELTHNFLEVHTPSQGLLGLLHGCMYTIYNGLYRQ
ncbi:hypothetical protein F4801DRAFT_139610 [Xylaria longipes]|nr:hypothetical protein F4801DRAFT_139610 [Xylaria longipes]